MCYEIKTYFLVVKFWLGVTSMTSLNNTTLDQKRLYYLSFQSYIKLKQIYKLTFLYALTLDGKPIHVILQGFYT